MKRSRLIIYMATVAALLLLLPTLAAISVGAQELEIANDCIVLDAAQICERAEAYEGINSSLKDENGLGYVRFEAEKVVDKVGFDLELGGGLDSFKYISFIVRSSYAGTKFRVLLKDGNGDFSKTVKADSGYAESSWWQSITVNLSVSDSWKGNNESVAVDLLSGFDFDAGAYCELACIFLCKTPEKVSDLATDFFGEQISAVQKISDFDELEVGYFNLGAYQTSVGIMNGSVVYEGTGVEGTSDPYATWAYKEFAESRGLTPLVAEDFKYIAVRYRCQHESKKITFNFYYQTGERTQAKGNCFAGENYKPSMNWRTIIVSFVNKPEWSGSVNSLRVDFANSIPTNTYARFEVGAFLFFDDLDAAKTYASAVNGIKVSDPEVVVEEDTYEGDTEVEILPWETETETVFEEETLPEYIEDSTDGGEEETEKPKEDDPKPEDTAKPEDEKDVPVKKEGSNTPFVIACILLALLSAASIVTVLVIRAKDKKKQ